MQTLKRACRRTISPASTFAFGLIRSSIKDNLGRNISTVRIPRLAQFAKMDNAIMTQIFPCNPTSISFSSDSTEPIISCPETLTSLRTAANELVSLKFPVVFPTETVYGLAAPAIESSVVSQIFTIKGRPADNPLIVHVSSLKMLRSLLPPAFIIPPAYTALMHAFWPGPLTLLFPTTPQIPSLITASHDTVAIRMPSHPVALALIALTDTPLAAPSANTSSTPSPTKAEHVFRNLYGKVRVILDGGPCNVGVESTVIDGLGADGCLRVLRPGGVTVEDMQRVLAESYASSQSVPRILVHRRDYQDENLEEAPTTPGMKYRHYSPSVPVVLLMTSKPPVGQGSSLLPDVFASMLSSYPADITVKIGLLTPSDSALALLPSRLPAYAEVSLRWHAFPLGPIADPSITAQRLFDGMLTLEEEGVDFIIVESVDETREGLAVMNRVKKAAGEVYWVNTDWPQPSE